MKLILLIFGTVFLLNNVGDIIYRWDNINDKSAEKYYNGISFRDKNNQAWNIWGDSKTIVYTSSDSLNIGTIWYKNSH